MRSAFRNTYFFLCLIVLLLSACKEIAIPPAGSYSEILLATEEGRASRHLPKILSLVAEEKNYVLTKEKSFKIEVVDAANLPEFPVTKNILIVGVANQVSTIGQKISILLGEKGIERVQSGSANIFKREDMPAPGQLTVIVTARSDAELAELLDARGHEIPEVIEASCRKRLRKFLLTYANKELINDLYRKYGFVIEVPTLYKLMSEDQHPPGVELMREPPTRSLGIFWADWKSAPTLSDSTRLFKTRGDYVWKRYDGDAMDSTRVHFRQTELGPYPSIKMEGYWYNTKATVGGFFQTYFVFEESEKMLWCVDLLVYAPGQPKHPHFRELLALAETFRYD